MQDLSLSLWTVQDQSRISQKHLFNADIDVQNDWVHLVDRVLSTHENEHDLQATVTPSKNGGQLLFFESAVVHTLTYYLYEFRLCF